MGEGEGERAAPVLLMRITYYIPAMVHTATSQEICHSGCKSIVPSLSLPCYMVLPLCSPQSTQHYECMRWLCQHGMAVVVWDDAEEEEEVMLVRPQSGG